jgi:hypothetical protein
MDSQSTRMGDAHWASSMYHEEDGRCGCLMSLRFFIILWSLLVFWGLTSFYYTPKPDVFSSHQPSTQEEPGEVTQVDPHPQDGLTAGVVAICDGDGSILNVIALHDTTIETRLFVQQQEAAPILRGSY